MKRTNTALIEELRFSANETRERRTGEDLVAFVTKGKLWITFIDRKEYIVKEGEAFSLSKSTAYLMKVLEDTSLTIFHMCSGREIPGRFFPELREDNSIIGREPETPHFYKVLMDSHMWSFVDTVKLSIEEAAESSDYLGVKIFELCHILKAGYSEKVAISFFRPIASGDYSFTDFVMDNYLRVATVSELVGMSPYSLSAFKRRFLNSFGETPYQWMKRQKTVRILHLINYSRMSFTEISFRTGFGSLPQFTAFCRKNLGEPPGVIRRRGSIKASLTKKNQGKYHMIKKKDSIVNNGEKRND